MWGGCGLDRPDCRIFCWGQYVHGSGKVMRHRPQHGWPDCAAEQSSANVTRASCPCPVMARMAMIRMPDCAGATHASRRGTPCGCPPPGHPREQSSANVTRAFCPCPVMARMAMIRMPDCAGATHASRRGTPCGPLRDAQSGRFPNPVPRVPHPVARFHTYLAAGLSVQAWSLASDINLGA